MFYAARESQGTFHSRLESTKFMRSAEILCLNHGYEYIRSWKNRGNTVWIREISIVSNTKMRYEFEDIAIHFYSTIWIFHYGYHTRHICTHIIRCNHRTIKLIKLQLDTSGYAPNTQSMKMTQTAYSSGNVLWRHTKRRKRERIALMCGVD